MTYDRTQKMATFMAEVKRKEGKASETRMDEFLSDHR